jgi:hypothetical protein
VLTDRAIMVIYPTYNASDENQLQSDAKTLPKENNMLSIEIKQGDTQVGMLAATEKTFKTGSRGFFGMGKIQIGEKRYQVQVQLVEIGSKPKAEGEA